MNSYPHKLVVARPKNVSQGGRGSPRLLGLILLMFCAVGMCLKANAANWTANNDGKDVAITAESCGPNGYIDPGETNTLSFVVKNTSGSDRAEVKVSLLEQGNVTFPSGEITVGNVAKDATFTVSFSFRATGSCGGVLTPTLLVKSSTTGNENVSFISFQLGATVKTTFNNATTSGITANDFNTDSAKLGRATPYPSPITVTGVPKADTGETVDRVSVTLNNLTHGFSQDLQVLLVGPNGKSVVLMANAGGSQAGLNAPVNNVNLTFDDGASGQLPPDAQIVSGTFKPSNFGASNFPDVGAATSGDLASAFNNMADPNGAWKLYVIDDSTGDQGAIAGGWSLSIRTTKIVCCGAGQLFPFVSRIGEATVSEDLNGGENVTIATFSATDLDDSDASKLTVTASSADTTKVTNDNLVLESNGANRTLKVKKLVANAFGNSTITVSVQDPQGHVSTSSFNLKITPVNDAPKISTILGQKLTQGSATGQLAYTLSDIETLPENLLVLVATSDVAVVPVENIQLSGTGANRFVNVVPASSATTGSATITLTVRDAGDGTNGSVETPMAFVVNFGATIGNPTITPLAAAASVDEDGSITIPFNVRSGDSGVSPDALVLSKASGNTTLLPVNNIVFSGSGTDRTVILTPAANLNGTASVTLTVANGSKTDSTSFVLTVNPKNDAPTITSVASQFSNEDSTSGDITFTVGDVETAAASLVVTVGSDNPTLIPARQDQGDFATVGGYQVTVNGGARTLKIRPAPNQFGKATVTVTVTDGGDGGDAAKATSTSFVHTINAVNDAPSITAVGNDNSSLQPWGANDPTVTFAEDSGSTADDTKAWRTIVLNGITPGPANESSQTTTVVASSSKPEIVSIVKIDPGSVTGASANTTLTVKLGTDKYTPADGLVEISMTFTDNGSTDLGGVNTAIKKFKINVTPVNDAPVLSFPTLPAPLPGATLSKLNVAKNRSFTLPTTLTDVETSKTLVSMSATVLSGDTESVFPNGSILFDAGRTLVTFLPVKVPSTLPYTVTVRITATDLGATNNSDDVKSTTRDFEVSIQDIEPPTINASATDIQIDEDNVATPLLTVADNKAVSGLTFSIKSDNTILVPNDGALLGPLSPLPSEPANTLKGQRTLAIVPATDQNGIANITVTVKDDEGIESQVAIKLTVRSVNDRPTLTLRKKIAPTLDSLGNSINASITILEDKVTADDTTDSKLLELDVTDGANETPVGNLAIAKASSNTDLVPVDNIVISGTGNRRTMTITPLANKNGSAVITLTLSDADGLNSSGQFTLNVTAVNDAPTINQISNAALEENAAEQTVNLTGITIGPDSGQSIATVVVTAKDKGSDPAVNNKIDITLQPALPNSDGATSFKYRPKQFVSGTAVLTVTVTDSGDTSNDGKNSQTMSFEVAIASVNQAPSFTFDQSTTTTSVDRTVDPGQATAIIPFYITDVETAVEQLEITTSSSNSSLVPNDAAHILIGGSFGTRSIQVIPAAGQSGSTVITISIKDKDGGVKTGTLNLTVRPGVNPTIVLTPNTQTVGRNQFSDLIQINVADAQTPADQLKTGYQEAGLVTSDNSALVPASSSNIQFAGSGSSRVMLILPTRDQTGTANITVRVKDSDGNIGSAVFTFKVLGAAPTITAPSSASVTVDANKTSPPVTVSVSDAETFPGLISVTGKSSDTTIIPDGNIFVLGGDTSRSVTVLAGSKGGSATITLTAKDSDGQTATTSFVVNVNDNNQAPTITAIGSQTTKKNTATSPINFVVGDVETAAGSLTVTAASSNTTLVPDSGIVVLTSSANAASRSLVITPANNQVGTTIVTVTVKDGGNKQTQTSFTLTVTDKSTLNDLNGDGSQDIVLQDNDGFLAAWFMSGDDLKQASLFTPNNVGDAGWKAVGTSDFDSDNKTDLLFQHTDGSLAVWKLNGVTMTSSVFLNPSSTGSADWKAVATADFNKDGKVDVLFQHTDGTLAIWYLDGVNLSSVATLVPGNSGPGWAAVGAGDINQDGNTDIVFQHTDGTLAVWYLVAGNNLLLPSLLSPQNPGDVNWRVVGTIDLNGDGKVDLLLQNRSDNTIAIWYMNKEKLILGKLLNPSNPGGTWRVVAP